jgi:hypothetical protein
LPEVGTLLVVSLLAEDIDQLLHVRSLLLHLISYQATGHMLPSTK